MCLSAFAIGKTILAELLDAPVVPHAACTDTHTLVYSLNASWMLHAVSEGNCIAKELSAVTG